jgi:TonB family protein
MNFLIDNGIRVSLLLAIGLGVRAIVRHRSAAVRHWVLAVAIVCALATPLLSAIVPAWQLAALFPTSSATPAAEAAVSTTESFTINSAADAGPRVLAPTAEEHGVPAGVITVLMWIWIAGAAISVVILLTGLARLTWLAHRAQRLDAGRWPRLSREVAGSLGLRRQVTILASDHPTLLVTWGFVRPKVIVPAAARDWSDTRARVVLRHELAHIRRHDWVVFMAAELLRAAHWFNPLVWIVCNRVRQESENACDDAVLGAGMQGAEYATHLIDLARTLNAGRVRGPELPAPAMARPSSLQGRITTMLNASLNRSPLTPSMRIASVTLLLAVTMFVAGVAAQRFYTFSGSVLDATNRSLPDAKLVVTNTASGAKHEVRSDRTGHFEFVGLPPGDYGVEASLAGFSPFKETINIIARDIEQTIDLHVGSLEETLTVIGSGADVVPSAQQLAADAVKRQERRRLAEDRQRAALARCEGAPLTTSGMGGQILAPLRLTSVNPTYPASARNAGVEGVVVMDAVIGADGNIQDVRVVSSPNPDLEAAAADAVRQWQFTPTLLNCVPIEVQMKVTARFKSQ